MYLKAILTAAAAIPASAIYDPDAPKPTGDGPALMALMVDEEQPAPAPGDVAITALPAEGAAPPPEGDVAITALPVDGANPLPSNDVAITSTENGSPILASDSQDEEVEEEEAEPVLYAASPLIGPTWSLVKYHNGGSGDLTELVDGSYITLEFEKDGRFDGHAGCNRYFGGYTDPADNSFSIDGPLGSTLMFCDDEISNQEFAYLQNFAGDINWQVSDDGTSLELTDADDGKILAQYELYSPLIIDTTWQATEFYDATQSAIVSVAEGSSITFKMEVNEKFDGNAGCNNYVGSYDDLTATSFVIDGPVGSTKMLCDPQNVNDQEYAYLLNFEDGRAVDWAVLDDGSLELKDADSGEVFAKYEAGLETQEAPLSDPESLSEQESGAMAFGTTFAALAMIATMVFV